MRESNASGLGLAQAGYYGTEFGVALFATATILTFTLLIWLNANLLDVQDREKRAAEAQLEASREEVTARKATEQLRTDFTAMLSHDIRNPIANVIGFANLLLENGAGHDPDTVECINPARNTSTLLPPSHRALFAGTVQVESKSLNLC